MTKAFDLEEIKMKEKLSNTSFCNISTFYEILTKYVFVFIYVFLTTEDPNGKLFQEKLKREE